MPELAAQLGATLAAGERDAGPPPEKPAPRPRRSTRAGASAPVLDAKTVATLRFYAGLPADGTPPPE